MFFRHFTNKIYAATEITSWCISFLHIYVVWREYKYIENVKERPEPVRKYMSSAMFHLLKRMNQSKLFIEMMSETWATLVRIIFSDELSHISLWHLSTRLLDTQDETKVTFVFIAVTILKDFLLILPMRVYGYIKFGEYSLGDTFQLMLLELCLEEMVQGLALNSLVYTNNMVPNVSKSIIISSVALSILGYIALRELMVEVFFERLFSPLEDDKVNKELKPFLKKMNFPEGRIYVMEMNEPTDMPNAFTVGYQFLNNQRIIIADNVIGKNKHLNDCCTHKEVAAIILHELGHVYYNHTLKMAFLDLALTLTTCIAFILLHEEFIFQSFGFVNITPVIVGIFIRMDLLEGYNVLSTLFIMIQARSAEFQADFFSFTFSKHYFRTALIKLYLIQPQDLQTHDSWYSLWNFDHPSLIERLNHVEGS